MPDQEIPATDGSVQPEEPKAAAPKKTAAKKSTTAKKTATKSAAKKVAKAADAGEAAESVEPAVAPEGEAAAPKKAAAKKTGAKKTAATKSAAKKAEAAETAAGETAAEVAPVGAPETAVLFQPPTAAAKKVAKKTTKKTAKKAVAEPVEPAEPAETQMGQTAEAAEGAAGERGGEGAEGDDSGTGRRRRRRGGRRRRKSGDSASADETAESGEGEEGAAETATSEAEAPTDGTSRRRRRRRRAGDEGEDSGDDTPTNTVTKVRQGRAAEDQITGVSGSTRLEAKKQRRREGREAGRRRAPIVSEAEFLARRESVDRVMVIRQRDDLTQIAVLEDKVLVEHYVARESQTSLIGNVYLGRVQNVLPSMEAAFIDIGRGRNAVLYAGEVNWSALGHPDGQPRRIESVLSSGQSVLVQVTKDPIGHKGARLTSQISLAGRFLVYVPDGTTSGISRKLPDTERNRLKTLLKEIVPDTAGVIVRTAAEGASEDELTRDVERLKARWADIESKAKGNAPQLLYGEPDLTLKVVRDLFTEDFSRLVIQGEDAWDTVQAYVAHVAPDLADRLEKHDPAEHNGADLFAAYRVDEQIAKGLDRKVWLPSGGSLVFDRTEAMTVVDVNTGKFTGSGGNLEETVTKNNLEAAEEIVRQLRLRDIGGIIVVDFIDMVLESNRDLVLRRLVECLGRDRTRHQVAEVTSLGLVQMTRKRIGTGLLEAFSETCEHCGGRGVVIHEHPVEPKRSDEDSRRGRRGRSRGKAQADGGNGNGSRPPTPKDVAAMARPPAEGTEADTPTEPSSVEPVETTAADTQTERTPVELVETTAADTPVQATPAEPPPVDPGETTPADVPAQPEPAAVVVTRARRRSASRPAGPPTSNEPTSTEPAAASAARGDADGVPAQVPSIGEVAAGTGAGTDRELGAPASDGAVEPGTVDAEPGPAERAHVEHVPIKRKGSRKR